MVRYNTISRWKPLELETAQKGLRVWVLVELSRDDSSKHAKSARNRSAMLMRFVHRHVDYFFFSSLSLLLKKSLMPSLTVPNMLAPTSDVMQKQR